MASVVIGVDPHKLSATIEVHDDRERVLGGGRFGTDREGYRQMLAAGRRWPQRVGAVAFGRETTAVTIVAVYLAINDRTVAPPPASNSSIVDSRVSPEPPCYRHQVPC